MELKNIARMGWSCAGANLLGRRLPLNVMLSVTNRCLSRCSYCNIPNRNQSELTTSQIFSLIDQISAMGCQRLGIWGGEPLIREDIGQIIDYAKQKELFVTLDSNGYLVPQKIKILARLDHLVLALDGPKQVHDANREPGSFEKTMAAISASAGKIPLWTITVLTRNNVDKIDFLLDRAREFGFFATFQIPHHNNVLAPDCGGLLAADDAYRRCILKIIHEKKKGAPVASTFHYLHHILRWPDYQEASLCKSNGSKCWAGKLYCNVDTDGSVYPCSLLVGKTPSLNFLHTGFKKAFTGLGQNYCSTCLASCFTEYNSLFSLNVPVIMDWLGVMLKTKR